MDDASRLRCVEAGEEIAAPDPVCPECSGGLILEVYEWETETGRPTEGGMHIGCAGDDEDHRYCQSDWIPVWWKVEEWARRSLRVRDSPRT